VVGGAVLLAKWWLTPRVHRANAIRNQEIGRVVLMQDVERANALRHARASKRIAEEMGRCLAAGASWADEGFDMLMTGDGAAAQIDLHNNREGRRAAVERRPISEESLWIRQQPSGAYSPVMVRQDMLPLLDL
jgi:hypothetical protein